MADNIELNSGSGGATLRTDDDGSAHWQYVKLAWGADNTQTIVTAANGVPVQPGTSTSWVLGAGTNAIGKLAANSGVDIGDVDVTSVVPGTGATNLGKAEDAVHASGDTGVMALGVRNDVLAALAGTDGDYAPLQVDANGALYVAVNGTVTVASHAVTNAGTFAVQAAQSGTWDIGTVTTVTSVTAIANALPAGDNNIGNVDIVTLPAGNLGMQLMAASLSIVPASNITDGTYIGDIKFGEALPAGANAIGSVSVTSMPGTAAEAAALPSSFVVVAADDGTDTHPLQVDINGNLKTVAQASTATQEVVGDAAENATAAGNPVLSGGRYDASSRTLGDGDVGALAISPQGWMMVANQSSYLFDGTTRCQVKRASGVAAGGAPGTDTIVVAVVGKKFRILALFLKATSVTANNVYLSTTTDTDVLGNSGNPIPLAVDADGDNDSG
ncbi:MAG: hypothetical protein ACE5GE_16080, partial [Phycisphaerae bacterium]